MRFYKGVRMKLVKTASGKQTIKMSKSEWQSIGKTAGWMGKSVLTAGEFDNAADAFGLGGGNIMSGQDGKAKEYAQRIVNGEPRDKILQNSPPIMIQKVDQFINQLQNNPQTTQQPVSIKAVANDLESIQAGLGQKIRDIGAKAMQGDQEATAEFALFVRAYNDETDAINEIMEKYKNVGRIPV